MKVPSVSIIEATFFWKETIGQSEVTLQGRCEIIGITEYDCQIFGQSKRQQAQPKVKIL
jgi:hypothetical protein